MLKNSVPFIMLNEKSAAPLYRQIYEAIWQAILRGKFQLTMPLPATRLLAGQLGVSRMTIINAYDQTFCRRLSRRQIGRGNLCHFGACGRIVGNAEITSRENGRKSSCRSFAGFHRL